MTRGNLVDQFKKPAAASVKSSSLSSTTVQGKPTVGQWFQKNWGKAAAIFIVVIITTIFIVRTVLIAKNKKKARASASAGNPGALNQSVEWESFLNNEMPPHLMQPPRHMPPPHVPHMQQMQQPLPSMPPMPPVRVPPQQVHQPQVQHVQQQHQQHVPQGVLERGLNQQRLPPADGAAGTGMVPSMMPQSSRPQNVTFTIDSAPPVVAAPEKDDPKKLDGEEPQLMPQDVDRPNTGVEFNR